MNDVKRTIPHPPFSEGNRQHVLSYHGGIINRRHMAWVRCSEPRCEINAEARALARLRGAA